MKRKKERNEAKKEMAEKKAVKTANKNKRKTAMRYRLERRVRRSSCGPGRVGRVSIGRATGRRSACTAAARPPCTAADSSTPRSPARPNSCPKKKQKKNDVEISAFAYCGQRLLAALKCKEELLIYGKKRTP